MEIKTITVIGANGAMGSGISGIFASFGGATVHMIGRDINKTLIAARKAVDSVKAGCVFKNIIPGDYASLAECIAKSDLIYESVLEDIEVKTTVTKLIAQSMRNDAVACTGTSGLSVSGLAELFPESLRGNFFGVHMFNPPYRMPLCELVATKYSDKKMMQRLKAYLTNVLLRTVVEVKDSPAFLANRIGFQFMNEALRKAEEHKNRGGIDYIDAILGPFTGRSMAPLVTSDFVGLDVHKAIVENIYANTHDYAHETFVFPQFALELIKHGNLGKKSGGGLYKTEKYDDCFKRITVYDISGGAYRDKRDYSFPFAEKMISDLHVGDYSSALRTLMNDCSLEAELCFELLLKCTVYSFVIAGQTGHGIGSADDVMAVGFNWCPPLAFANAISQIADFKAIAMERIPKICEMVDIDAIAYSIIRSKYDYRRYFKAVK